MPDISWNEVKDRTIRFAKEWAGEKHERAEKQTFWNKFFECFGINRRSVAVFERAVGNLKGHDSYIDLFWRGLLLVEHKSYGGSFAKAESQAFKYMEDLAREGKHDELPRYVVLCDFDRFALFDLEPESQKELPLFDDGRPYRYLEFRLEDLHRHAREFAFIKGEKPVRLRPEDPANLKATRLLADLHDALADSGYKGHALERMLVRILFCLFAEDTGIFDSPGCFTALVEKTREDGSDLGMHLENLFQVLNAPLNDRQRDLDEDLAAFPFVNGGLFEEGLRIASFNRTHRDALVKCCGFHWARISPAVFGSLFQGIMEDRKRRQIGAHYTSERDIMKVIHSLFLDDLRAELDAALQDRSTGRRKRLQEFQLSLRKLRFFDPACGCGNFLVLSYRELRRLENETLIALHRAPGKSMELDIRALAKVDVDQFFGLEIEEWPVRIAEVGLWLTDHQCNVELAEALGQHFVRLPLRAAPTLKVANALRTDWRALLPPDDHVLVLGNPPFVGKKEQNADQKSDMALVWSGVKGAGILDYVTCWYRKAAEYIQGTPARCAFVSTNSISQGEQVGVLWDELFGRWKLKIHFAHRTFAWSSEAEGRAHVHVVIIGFGTTDRTRKPIFEYDHPTSEPVLTTATNINPYLLSGGDTTVRTRTTPINGAPQISYGSMMIDKGRTDGDDAGLILSPARRTELLAETPELEPYIRRLYGGDEFLNGTERWCLWLENAPAGLLRQSPLLRARIEKVRQFRLSSNREQTRELAMTPSLFGEIRQPKTPYLLIPKVSSEGRRYIPIGFLPPDVIASGSALVVPGATLWHFGVLSSAMHNTWMRAVAGRLESRYQYSNNIVYNNFPWPSTDKSSDATQAVEAAAERVLAERKKRSNQTLADLYDQLAMPAELVTAHAALDRSVDRCYRKEPFKSDRERVEFLFALYESITAPLAPAPSPRKPRRPRKL